ncbi:MAG: prepilin-type N-terminal cleavage/methylation domain-containing protein [Akkermansiaceae bacterium]|nr:prepilin-type N-terminal cleavage/methylation domain-containing protein [Akkermansiaceae bacterium]
MNTTNSPSLGRRFAEQAFTLMELMVVIVIIGILTAVTIPGAKAVMDSAQKARCRADAYSLKNAIGAYFTEYKKYPVQDPPSSDYQTDSSEELMSILLGSDDAAKKGGMNPRQIVFFQGKQAKKGKDGWTSGVHLSGGGSGELYDPWANYYLVTIDTDYNGRVEAPDFEDSVSEIPQGVIVWSEGKEEGEDNDNVATW